MRTAIAFAILVMASVAALGVAFQKTPTSGVWPFVPAAQSRPANPVETVGASRGPSVPRRTANEVRAAAPVMPAPTCDNPNALGVSRVVEIDTSGGPGFGFEQFKGYDFLKPNEVVLTFDDGPWLNSTPLVLKALADQCVKATFFAIGKHATYYPEILKQVAQQGHTVGSHTWSHKDLSKMPVDAAKEEIEKGVSAVKWALGGAPIAPFFRFPALRMTPQLVTYLGERNIAMFSTDMDSFDFKIHKPEQVIKSVMDKLTKHGKGIVLLHDFHINTAHALPELLAELKRGGFKVVQLKAKDPVQSIAQYDGMIAKDQAVSTIADQRPMSRVVHTVAGQ